MSIQSTMATLFYVILVFLTNALKAHGTNGSISSRRVPGCADLEAFQTTFDQLNPLQLTKINCLCGSPEHYSNDETMTEKQTKFDEEMISIICIYGSKISDLRKTLEFVAKANKTVKRMILDHLDFYEKDNPNSMEQILLSPQIAHMVHLEIKKCKGSPNLDFEALSKAIFDSFAELVIEECDLERVPTKLIRKGPKLKRISLANNKISILAKTDFDGVEMLETLDLAGNLLSSSLENESLSQLKNIKHLAIGGHNFASVTLMTEIGRLKTLESLDMSQMDGIDSIAQFENFKNINGLKRLVLRGCSLKQLSSGGLSQFPALEWLDVRVNLIERLMENSFKGLDNLQFLSLSGNFIRDLPTKLWQDLPALENLEMGWNEMRELNGTSFKGMSKRLQRMHLGNNEALRKIDLDTFDGLDTLQHLNISGTHLEKIPASVFNLPKLKELDLSSSNIIVIEKSVQNATRWYSSNSSIEWLDLSKNALSTLDATLLEGMKTLKVLDLSENRWLCDEQMQKIVTVIDSMYKIAASKKREFELRHSERTQCERPFTRKGDSVFELLAVNANELRYDERWDTTRTRETEPTTTGPGVIFGGENATIDWKSQQYNNSIVAYQITLFIGSQSNDHLNFTAVGNKELDANIPKYDINSVKYGEKSAAKKETNSLLSGVVVTLLVISTAFCIIIVARRMVKKEDGNEKVSRKSGGTAQTQRTAEDTATSTF